MDVSKDYYQVLGVPPFATQEEIKKSYRLLAFRYHPDTSQTNKETTNSDGFRALNEAYNILSSTDLREKYHSKRFFSSIKTLKKRTPLDILNQIEKLSVQVLESNPFMIDFDLLIYQIKQSINPIDVEILIKSQDSLLIKKIIEGLYVCSEPLPYKKTEWLWLIMMKLSENDKNLVLWVSNKKQYHAQVWFLENNKNKLIIGLSIALCILIYVLGK